MTDRSRSSLALFLTWLAISVSPSAGFAQKVQHPLDPLTWQEYWTVLEVLNQAGRVDTATRFSIVNLDNPDKSLVWAWKPGDRIPRAAYALVRQKDRSYEAIVDITARRITSFDELRGAQPNFLREEYEAMSAEVKSHPEFIAAMRRRGITDLTFIDCGGGPPGYFATEEQRGRRIAYMSCEDPRGVRNTWTRQIEGLTVVVDMNERRILRVVDEGAVPMPSASADYDVHAVGPTRAVPSPLRMDQPLGPGFTLDGHVLEWQNWRLHVRPDQRVGMIISTVTYQDGDRRRPVLYEGSLSEIFVPYMDPAFSWYVRNFLDAGEFHSGGLSKPLLQGLDCPPYAVYLDALIADGRGRPQPISNIICIFERLNGEMSWRHWARSTESESRVKRDLVVRTAAVLGNYDYIFDWVFQQDGAIRVAVGATGIAEVKMVAQENARAASPVARRGNGGSNGEPAAERGDAYGRFVDRQIVAVNHDHYFNFRLDLDVDGVANSMQVDYLTTEMLPADHPRRSIWVNRPVIAQREADGKLDAPHATRAALWRVVNPARTNHVGYPTSYQLLAGMSSGTLLSSDDYPRRRAGFIDHQLWVTPYRKAERYAAGDHPTLSEPGLGLPAWTSENRSIENTDIVLWHSIGMHHMARAEDWPVMPVLWHSFELRPFDFFNRNPALDLPR